MKYITKIGLSVAVAASLFVLKTASASANEGFFELQNTIGGASRCHVTSGLFSDGQYNVFFLCRDLVYPISSDLFVYVVWTQPSDGSNPVKLGTLGVGKVIYKTNKPFSSIIVTQERANNDNLRAPTGPIAMRGNFQQIRFLDNPTNIQAPTQPGEVEQTPLATIATSPAPRRGISNIIKGGGIITAISVFLIILMLILVKPFK